MKRLGALLIVSVAGCASTWVVGPATEASVFADHEIPRVDVMINGQGPFRFLVATGVDTSIVSPKLAARLQLAANGETVLRTGGFPTRLPTAVVHSLALGGVEAQDLPVVIAQPPDENDGMLGSSFLGQYRVTLDYPAARLTLEK
jgi:predicted aspartyl protease